MLGTYFQNEAKSPIFLGVNNANAPAPIDTFVVPKNHKAVCHYRESHQPLGKPLSVIEPYFNAYWTDAPQGRFS
jgi:hypothetical protein